MAYLENLIPRLSYTRADYVRALRAMLPRGVFWNIPLPNESDIRPYGIASAEQFGRVTIFSGETYITPNGILSTEAFGDPFVLSASVILPAGIASQAGVGYPTVGFGWLQYCNFESSLCSGWNTQFLTNWYQTSEGGETIAQRGSQGVDQLYPAGSQMLSGDFVIELGFWRSASQFGNDSVHLQLFNSSNVKRLDIMYYQNAIRGVTGDYPANVSGEYRVKIVRSSGVIWCYQWTGSAWLREDSWSTPGSSVNNSETLKILVDGADGINGFTYIGINGTVV